MYQPIEQAKICMCSRNFDYQEKWWERYNKYLETLK